MAKRAERMVGFDTVERFCVFMGSEGSPVIEKRVSKLYKTRRWAERAMKKMPAIRGKWYKVSSVALTKISPIII